jgi:hypothetical protein
MTCFHVVTKRLVENNTTPSLLVYMLSQQPNDQLTKSALMSKYNIRTKTNLKQGEQNTRQNNAVQFS